MKLKTVMTTAAAAFLLTGINAQAGETRLISASDSPYAEVCIAAVESETAARETAAELGLIDFNMSGLVCNGEPAEEFVQQYSERESSESELASSPEFYALTANDQSPATELCIAAVISDERFEAVKSEYFNRLTEDELAMNVRCNSMPLERFVQEYGNAELTASL